jgi:hypothetical protein
MCNGSSAFKTSSPTQWINLLKQINTVVEGAEESVEINPKALQ